MRFEDAYTGWTENRLTQEEAADRLGVCSRTFRRYVDRYEEAGLEGLREAPVGGVAPQDAGGRGDRSGGPVPEPSRGLEPTSFPRPAAGRSVSMCAMRASVPRPAPAGFLAALHS